MLGQEIDKSKRELYSLTSFEKIKFWECLLLFILESSLFPVPKWKLKIKQIRITVILPFVYMDIYYLNERTQTEVVWKQRSGENIWIEEAWSSKRRRYIWCFRISSLPQMLFLRSAQERCSECDGAIQHARKRWECMKISIGKPEGKIILIWIRNT